jgi:hypothetical protein
VDTCGVSERADATDETATDNAVKTETATNERDLTIGQLSIPRT